MGTYSFFKIFPSFKKAKKLFGKCPISNAWYLLLKRSTVNTVAVGPAEIKNKIFGGYPKHSCNILSYSSKAFFQSREGHFRDHLL